MEVSNYGILISVRCDQNAGGSLRDILRVASTQAILAFKEAGIHALLVEFHEDQRFR